MELGAWAVFGSGRRRVLWRGDRGDADDFGTSLARGARGGRGAWWVAFLVNRDGCRRRSGAHGGRGARWLAFLVNSDCCRQWSGAHGGRGASWLGQGGKDGADLLADVVVVGGVHDAVAVDVAEDGGNGAVDVQPFVVNADDVRAVDDAVIVEVAGEDVQAAGEGCDAGVAMVIVTRSG